MQEIYNDVQISGVIRRRWKSFILSSVPLFLLIVFIALMIPTTYLAKCTILVETQQIPQEYVRTTITSYVEERLQAIAQRIMRRSKLQELIDRFDLYAEMKEHFPSETIIEEMRDAINLETISTEVVDRRTGRPASATIAFAVSYEGKDPRKVEKVANILASFYLEENLKVREQQATHTITFLQTELDEIRDQIEALESKISDFKSKHVGALPEFVTINMQAIERLNREADQLDTQIMTLKERKIYLTGQLSGMERYLPEEELVIGKNVRPDESLERLKALRIELANKQSSVSEIHPDVKRLKAEIAKLEKEVGPLQAFVESTDKLALMRAQFATSSAKLGPDHPDIIKLKKEIELLEKDMIPLDVTQEPMPGNSEGDAARLNPTYLNFETQVATAEMEIVGLTRRRQEIAEDIEEYQNKIETTPLVEKEYNILTRDYQEARQKYSDIMNKLMEAKVSQGMEESQSAERFTIIDPAQLPEKPYKPNRMAIIIIGLVLSLGVGVGVAAARESLDYTIKTPRELRRSTDVPVLAIFQYVELPSERRKRILRRFVWIALVLSMVGGAAAVFNYSKMPLDVLWAKIQHKSELMFPYWPWH